MKTGPSSLNKASGIKKISPRKNTSKGLGRVEKSFFPGKELPRIYNPGDPNSLESGFLPAWITKNKKTVDQDLLEYGAILFRGFSVSNPLEFEAVALALDKNLKTDYLGTSPRNRVTKFVHTASELPPYYPIMQHAEMSFLNKPPRKLMFYCEVPPIKNGETPITDLRKVYEDMNPGILKKFETKGVKYIRRYDGPNAPRVSMWKTKRWDEMFSTVHKEEVEKIAARQTFQVDWLPQDELKLTNIQVSVRTHPTTKTKAWHNHSQVFHVDAALLEYQKIAKYQKSIASAFLYGAIFVLTSLKKLLRNPEKFETNIEFGDGTPISSKEIREVSDTFWNHLSVFGWQKGDVLLIDNYSVSHGRLPFSGPREILVTWTD
ncbi:taurine catabolism dioxygenase, TauD/TfdA family [Leptospira broomii serovar Hurstbridge str. 5399]|uniref:Taurine catabolism dioxygenase, TauD/TfdA family n=1 Tax=Leptospira broomii serovar Hurstbridge str. 5399 TaxID=1049789 RepID=T0FAS5_9LEPT|nr:TauD/TfdA family dioxygenase [Leptospira broomii]EQA44642.1 taurine catabolism dioxygenase, TauD/TfdA family [Leptospira broomii serovar Hurstbridge str. 5399]